MTQTILHNRTGGLQVLPPGSTEWYYVKACTHHVPCLSMAAMPRDSLRTHLARQPIPGFAICNIGDALNIFSGGILRSNIHRVV